MKEHTCEYTENNQHVVIKGTLEGIHRIVGGRHVTLDGCHGHFQRSEDEHASLTFISVAPSKGGAS